MALCPKCHQEHPEGVESCPEGGDPLEGDGVGLGVAETAYEPGDGAAGAAEQTVPGTVRVSTPPGTELIGQTIGGVYHVEDLLGVGGMGVVYRVRHVNLEKEFALKVLGQVTQDHPEAVERFRQEAIAASHIEHDNIVDIITLDATPTGTLYIVMELLKGQSLADALRRDGPMPLERALPIMYQICRALHAAHEAGIIHRDLKPENIFLTPKGEAEFVKVLDFGISKIHAAEHAKVRITKTGHVLGTPLYMSPEQAKGDSSLDRRVDIYSMGVILFEMLEGHPPFQGDNYFQLIWKHTNEAPPPLTADVPEALREVVMQALSKLPDDRFATAVEFEEAIQRAVPEVPPPPFLDFRPTMAPPPPASTSHGAPRRRALGVIGALVAAGIIAVVGFVFAGQWGEGGEATERQVLSPHETGDAGAEARAGEVSSAVLGVARAVDGGGAADSAGQADASAAATDTVRLELASTPRGAVVEVAGQRVGSTPLSLQRPRDDGEVEVRFLKRGYRPVVRRLHLDRDHRLDVRLQKRGAVRSQGGSGLPPIKTAL